MKAPASLMDSAGLAHMRFIYAVACPTPPHLEAYYAEEAGRMKAASGEPLQKPKPPQDGADADAQAMYRYYIQQVEKGCILIDRSNVKAVCNVIDLARRFLAATREKPDQLLTDALA